MTGLEILQMFGIIITAALIVFNFVMLKNCMEGIWTYEEAFNPIYIYNHISVNVFGAILLCILGHICLLPAVPFYWLYKLCTVGRR